MRRTAPMRSFTDRPGYGDYCAVCPFCGKINDSTRTETSCHHLVRWTGSAYHERAVFTDGGEQKGEPKQ